MNAVQRLNLTFSRLFAAGDPTQQANLDDMLAIGRTPLAHQVLWARLKSDRRYWLAAFGLVGAAGHLSMVKYAETDGLSLPEAPIYTGALSIALYSVVIAAAMATPAALPDHRHISGRRQFKPRRAVIGSGVVAAAMAHQTVGGPGVEHAADVPLLLGIAAIIAAQLVFIPAALTGSMQRVHESAFVTKAGILLAAGSDLVWGYLYLADGQFGLAGGITATAIGIGAAALIFDTHDTDEPSSRQTRRAPLRVDRLDLAFRVATDGQSMLTAGPSPISADDP